MKKPEPAQVKADCIEKINILLAEVESGKVTEVLLFGILDQEEFDYFCGAALTAGNLTKIIISESMKIFKALELKFEGEKIL